jgi:hypothetical protein
VPTQDEVIKEFSSNTLGSDTGTRYPGHLAYDNIKIIPVEESHPGSAQDVIQSFEKVVYVLPFSTCVTNVNDVLKAYGVESAIDTLDYLKSSVMPLGAPELLLLENIVPNIYYSTLPGTERSLNPQSAGQTAPSPPSQDIGEKNDHGGVNFTSIKLNYIYVNEDSSGDVNFDLVLKAEKAEGASPGIDVINSTLISEITFMTGLAVPDNKFWVNLNPWEPDRIIDEQLKQSEVGRIMLEADLQMKRDFSNYGNPCANETGKALWDLLDKKHDALVQWCMLKFPGEIKNIDNVQFRPVTRHWIVPDKVYAYTNRTQIYIINATLRINSEPVANHSSFQVYNQDTGTLSKGCREELNKSAKEYGKYYKELEDYMILPYVVADVNRGGKYEDLRNVYVALALAQWYKSRITPHMDIFRDSLDSSNSTALISLRSWSPNEIWDKYVYSFKNHEYKCWRNETTKTATGTLTKSSSCSAGGVDFYSIKAHLVEIKGMPTKVQDQVKRAISDGFISEGKDVLFGNRLHVAKKKETLITGSSSVSSPKTVKQKQEAPKATAAGSTRNVTCPEGWMGPDEKGECWKLQITSKN